MDVLKKLLDDAKEVLSGLTTTGKVVFAFFVLTITALLSFVAFLGSTGKVDERVALPGRIAPEEANEIKAKLDGAGLGPAQYLIEDRKVTVPFANRSKSIMFLAENKLLPRNAHTSFEEMIKNSQFYDTRYMSDTRYNDALQNEVGWMVESLDGVRSARVVYAKPTKGSWFGKHMRQRATVTVATRLGQELTQGMAESIVRLVAFAKSGLGEEDVVVTDQGTGRSFRSRSSEAQDQIAMDKMNLIEKTNERLERKIQNAVLSYIPNSRAAVFVEAGWDMTRVEETSREVLEGAAARTMTRTITDDVNSRPSNEVGTGTNVVDRAATAGALGRIESRAFKDKRSDTTMAHGARITKKKYDPKMTKLMLSVIVTLPYALEDYDEEKHKKGQFEFLRTDDGEIYTDETSGKQQVKIPTAPIDETSDAYSNLRMLIRKAAGIPDTADPSVMDVAIAQVQWAPALEPPVMGPGMVSQIKEVVNANLLPIFLFMTVMTAIFLFWRLARESIQSEAPELEPELVARPKAPMTETDKAQADFEQLRNQIGDMVDDNPSKAAGLIRRWMQTRDAF